MNRSHIVTAMLTCMGLCFAAGAAESVNTGGASNGAAVNAAPSREAGIKADRVGDRELPRTGAPIGGPLKNRHSADDAARLRNSAAQSRGVDNASRIMADPRNLLKNAQANRHLVPRSVGSTQTGAGGARIGGPIGTSPVGQRPRAASTRTTLPAIKAAATPRDSAVGGPRVQALGRIGGPVFSRASHRATLDGTQLHHKF